MAGLSEWLQLMLAEIARREEELQQDAEEEARRRAELRSQAPDTQLPDTDAVPAPSRPLRRARR